MRLELLRLPRDATLCFNPRTHTGCDISSLLTSSDHKGFNPRTHTGCDRALRLRMELRAKFQSTHPHGVRLSGFLLPFGGKRFQSTHPHGVRLAISVFAVNLDFVSIHAPTRGATCIIRLYYLVCGFQSTHPHGVRQTMYIVLW